MKISLKSIMFTFLVSAFVISICLIPDNSHAVTSGGMGHIKNVDPELDPEIKLGEPGSYPGLNYRSFSCSNENSGPSRSDGDKPLPDSQRRGKFRCLYLLFIFLVEYSFLRRGLY